MQLNLHNTGISMINLNKLIELKQLLLLKYGNETSLDSVRMCSITINNRMRSTAGRANYARNEIIMNERLLNLNPEHIEQTFAHELAHLISFALYGRNGTGHGRLWQEVMVKLGYSPERTHSLDVKPFKRVHAVKGTATCGCTVYNLKSKRFTKLINGVKYKCLKCGRYLELIDDKSKV